MYQKVVEWEKHLRYYLQIGFLPNHENILQQLQRQLNLQDQHISHLFPLIWQGRQHPCYIAEQKRNQEQIRLQQYNFGMQEFYRCFDAASQDGIITNEEWNKLQNITKQYNLPWIDAINFVRPLATKLIEKIIAFALNDGELTKEEEGFIYFMYTKLNLDVHDQYKIVGKLEETKSLLNLKKGILPIAQEEEKKYIYLDSNEICHLVREAECIKVVSGKAKNVGTGQLIITNKKLYFSSGSTGANSVPFENIIKLYMGNERKGLDYFEIESTKKCMTAKYSVVNARESNWFIFNVIDHLIKKAKFNLNTKNKTVVMDINKNTTINSRHIPKTVKKEVWQRDQGKCVICKDSAYLEFDHIIPFSKGGANTVNNIQILCRHCNLKKRDNI